MEEETLDMLEFLRQEGVSERIVREIEHFRSQWPAQGSLADRVPVPRYLYYGKDVWEEAATALLCGENLLLAGPKATGKNVLAENLAAAFGRPSWDVSFYINTDAATLLGTDTFANGAVSLRKGPIYRCAEEGGFGILDEINMAKNESLAVLHATLDFRRSIDMPGYERIRLHDATRFIATMNYGYAGTRELNEALCSRFVVLDMPAITEEGLMKLLRREFPRLKQAYASQLAGLFQDIQKKCDGGELSTKPLDLRGLVASVRLMRTGLEGNRALELGLVNKSFDDFEKQLVTDVIRTRLPDTLNPEDVFD
ncbi:MAG: AAA family ATPase [Dysosmobacter sp.]|jgi:nitric oxide reductase NorQ protein|uniref:AAA family ATPase n=1 Tax=Dysosmobacter sp. TaxID=2591382 RepID=UPI003D913BBD